MAPINLYSDTQTRPTDGMRAAIAAAIVGDEQRRLDPTTLKLQERVASLLGHEAVTHLDVSREDVEQALDILAAELG